MGRQKGWEAQRSLWAAQPISSFCIKVGNIEKGMDFFPIRLEDILEEELLPFAIKDFSFPVGERAVKFPNVVPWMAEG